MISSILQLDEQITSILTNIFPHNPFFEFVFAFLSLHGYAIYIWIVVLAVLMIIEGRKDKMIIVYFLVTFFLSSFLISNLLKPTFQRQRPIPNEKLYSSLACPTDYSFPSGHAAGAFASATMLSAFDRKRRYFYFFIAVLISFSRVYLQCHYFVDVIIGAFVGVIVSRTLLLIRRYHN